MTTEEKPAFENVLQKINKYIRLKDSDREKYTDVFNSLIHTIITELREEDAAFKALYNGPVLAGSYVDNLKITKPDEFDLVLRMKLIESKRAKVERVKGKPGYVKIDITEILNTIKNQQQNKIVYDKLTKLVEDNNYLSQSKFQQWIESTLTKVLLKNCHEFKTRLGQIFKVQYSKTGPAHTIKLRYEGNVLSIDLVPAFVFDKSKWVAERQPPVGADITDWIAVAKPIKNATNNNKYSFQASYVDSERFYLKNKNNFKNTLRMIKKLRDRHGIQNLKSYFIKTVFLWENLKLTPEFWRQSAGKILLYMLEKLVEYVAKGNMPFFWDKAENMFASLSQTQLKTMLDQLSSAHKLILKYSTEDPNRLYDIFLTHEEILDMNQRQQRGEHVANRSGGDYVSNDTNSNGNRSGCNMM